MIVRLFTAGRHNGHQFSNEDIDRIFSSTQEKAADRIPVVLGHPINNLPIMGFVPRAAISKYDEGSCRSIGFKRETADFSEESLEALRKTGRNKISIRLKNGVIEHIGLVERPAVKENALQDFAALSGAFDMEESILTEEERKAAREKTDSKKTMETEKKVDTQAPSVDELKAQLDKALAEKKELEKSLEAQRKAAEDIALASEVAAFEEKIRPLNLSEGRARQAVVLAKIFAGKTVDFEAADGTKTSVRALAELADLLINQRKIAALRNGSVAHGDEDFKEKNKTGAREAALAELTSQYKNITGQ